MATAAASPLPSGSVPIPRTRLIGREADIAVARAFLLDEAVPLLTLTGPGGVGKTRLALAITQDVADAFADGAVFVDLAPLRDPRLVLSAVAAALDIRDADDRAPRVVLTRALRSRQLLLVLDNCEHLLAAASDLAALLAGCPRLQALATSRAPLHIQGEHELAVPPLALPPAEGARRDDLLDSEAVALFLQRSRAANHTYVPDEDELRVIAELCRRLDGLPLAIELAASRVKLLTPRTLLAHLPRQRRLLASRRRDVPDRQRTLWATLTWSYDLLRPDEQALLRRLAVFVGGFTLDAAAAIAGFPSGEGEQIPSHILDGLSTLVDHSLLLRIEQPEDEPRFRMLETIHAFAMERLTESTEATEIHRRHARWCLQVAEWTAASAWQPAMRVRLRRVAAEADNIRAALSWAFDADPTLGIHLAVAMAIFWTVRGPIREGLACLERALTLMPTEWAPAQRARVCYAAGLIIQRQQDLVRAEEMFRESLHLYEACGDRQGKAEALFFLAQMLHWQHVRGDPRGAAPLLSRAVALCREVDHPLLGYALANIGLIAHKCGDDAGAAQSLHEAAALFAEHGDQWGFAMSQDFLCMVALDRGEAKQAATLAAAALRIAQDEGDRISVLEAVFWVASAAAMLGQGEAAGRLVGAVDRHMELFGVLPDPDSIANRERAMDALRRTMGQERTAALVLAGQAMPFGQVVAEALALADRLLAPDTDRASRSPRIAGLSAREHEVLRLIATGRTNAEIADMLTIAPRTVATHSSHILNKLGLGSRSELIAFAHREGLI